MFDDPDCTGKFGRFFASTTYGVSNDYDESEIWYHNVGSNQMNSILVPYGTSVTLWDNSGFGGSTKTIVG